MKTHQIAVQLYTLRDYLQTPTDIAATLKRVRRIGYQAVEVAGVGGIPVKELRRILDGEGLACCATHEAPLAILNETEWVVERLQELGCRHASYPWPEGCDLSRLQDVVILAGKLDKAGKKMRRAGQVLAYHNHAAELARVEGRTVLDWIHCAPLAG